MAQPRIYTMSFSRVYPMYVAKAEVKSSIGGMMMHP
ncbi:MAG: hypothetical protein PWP25_1434 [Sphaerochaeta sp.]|jgi:hypothetical protein|nr:hypothetical protein [Sphaerochaeta sp.]